MLRNRFLLASLAFSISFGISLLTTRDAGKALATGLTTIPATVIAAIAVDYRFQRQANLHIAALKSQIRALQKRRVQAYQALKAMPTKGNQMPGNQLAPDAGLMPLQVGLQPPKAPSVQPRQPLSWNLSAPVPLKPVIEVKPHELPTEFQVQQGGGRGQKSGVETHSTVQTNAALQQAMAEAAATKGEIETTLKVLQTELKQLKTQVDTQRQTRDRLTQELTNLERRKQQLETQKRQLETESSKLKQDVSALKRQQKELDQSLSQTAAKQQELEQGSHPLHTALKQLQIQVTSHQEELLQLENQVSDRQRQKIQLEQQLAILKAQQQEFKQSPAQIHSALEKTNGNKEHGKGLQTQPAIVSKPGSAGSASAEPIAPDSAAPKSELSKSELSQPELPKSELPKPGKQEKPVPEKPGSDLPQEWTEFMVALPEYEFLVLRAIAEQPNPAAVIKKIAEDNLTMPELLIDSINEQALETVGDIIIEPKSGSESAAISREHQKAVRKLIKTYEYLTE